jgi:hypothetical protein
MICRVTGVRVNITVLVKYWTDNPSANHGIVVGSLTGDRFGVFSLHQRYGDGVLARVRYMY